MMSIRPLILLLVLFGAPLRRTQAQTSIPAPGPCDTRTSNNGACRLHLVVTNVIRHSRALTVLPSADFTMAPAGGQLTAADYDAGAFDVAGKLTLIVSSTSAWRVTLQATSAQLAGACAARPASSIRWGLSQSTRTTPLSTTPVTVASGTSYTVNQPIDIHFNVGLDWLRDAPASSSACALPVTFTVTTP